MNTRRTVLVIVTSVVLVAALFFTNYFINFKKAVDIASRMQKDKGDTISSSGVMKLVSISDMKQQVVNIDSSKTYFFNVFATWCKPCIEELPYIEKLYQTYGASAVFFIISDETTDRLQNFSIRQNTALPIYRVTNTLPAFLSSLTIPYTVIVKNGKVVYAMSAEMNEADYKEVERLLK